MILLAPHAGRKVKCHGRLRSPVSGDKHQPGDGSGKVRNSRLGEKTRVKTLQRGTVAATVVTTARHGCWHYCFSGSAARAATTAATARHGCCHSC